MDLSSREQPAAHDVTSGTGLVNGVGGLVRNKHMTAQSSTQELGYLRLQALTARVTNNLAAMDRFFAEATILITSLFVNTSHTCDRQSNQYLQFPEFNTTGI
jgi:hypothetical protein